MTEVASSFVTLIPSLRGVKGRIESELGAASGPAGVAAGKKMGSGITAGIGSSIKSFAGGFLAVIGVQRAVDLLGDSVSAASDLSEAGNKIKAVFGPAAAQVEQFASGGARTLGQTTLQTLDAAATFGAFGKAAGLAGKDLAGFSTGFSTLSTDLASFYNSSPQEAIDAIGAALRGESEPIRKYGVLLDDATLRQEAVRLGIIKTTKQALTPQQKVLAAQSAIYKQTKDAQGDFARTSGGLANQQRILGAQWEGFKATIGRGLLPVMTGFVSFLNEKVLPGLSGIGDVAGPAAGALMRGLGPLVSFVRDQVIPRVMGIVDAVRSLITTAAPIVTAFASGMVQRMSPLVPTIRSIFTTIGGIISGALDLIASVVGAVTGGVSLAWNAWGEGLMDTIRTIFGAFAGVVEPAMRVIQGIIDAVTSAIRGDWSGVWNAMKRILSAAWDAIKGAISAAVSIVKQLLSTAWSAVKTVASSAWSGIVDAVKTAVVGLVEFVKGIPGRIVSGLGDLGGLLVGAGQNIVAGLITGIASKGAELIGWLRQWVADHIPGPIASFLGIASPSKVTARLGQYAGEGLIQGLSRTSAGVERSALAVAGRMTSGLSSGPAVLAGSRGGIDYARLGAEVAAALAGVSLSVGVREVAGAVNGYNAARRR